jgi:TM2 domain-containing membrane protein YozV
MDSAPPRRSTTGNAVPPLLFLDPLLTHPPKRRTTVLLLCLFLGWLGCHRFYVGKRKSGRIYLMTGGILFFGVLVDLGLILAGSFEDRFGQPLI